MPPHQHHTGPGPKTDPKTGRPRSSSKHSDAPARLWLYGRHAVAAALANPERRVRRVLATKNAAAWLAPLAIGEEMRAKIEDARPEIIDKALPAGAVHQGLAAEVFDLERARLKEACAPAEVQRPVVVLDQITDPQNIGAIFRSAAAFGARAVIVQDRRTPPLSGALAKAAAGAIESVACVKVVNIARALEALANLGYATAGLMAQAERDIGDLPKDQPIALVLGAEGAGLRKLVGETCTHQTRIPIAAQMESLNVSTAAAIALYEITRK
jgi:23S rRNA (guanosine2251-2'-O)-methyltransferase